MLGSARGLRIEEVAGGFRLSTRPELAPWIRTHFRNRNRARLSPASIETLAVVAYKQPVTGPEIQEIRGVDPQGSLKTLLEKRLIRMAGKKKVVGRPCLYKTTRQFLMHFGLAGVEDLPPIEDFERLAGEFASASGAEAAARMTQRERSRSMELQRPACHASDSDPEGRVGSVRPEIIDPPTSRRPFLGSAFRQRPGTIEKEGDDLKTRGDETRRRERAEDEERDVGGSPAEVHRGAWVLPS